MATEVIEIREGENLSENSVQPEATSERRRRWFVKRMRVSRCNNIPAAEMGWTALGGGADSHFRRWTMNDWPGRVSSINQIRRAVGMGVAVFKRMFMFGVMTQALSQCPRNPAINKHE